MQNTVAAGARDWKFSSRFFLSLVPLPLTFPLDKEKTILSPATRWTCVQLDRIGSRHDVSRACLSSPADISRLSDIRIDTFRAPSVSMISRDACTHKHRVSRRCIKGRANFETMSIDTRYSASVVLSSDTAHAEQEFTLERHRRDLPFLNPCFRISLSIVERKRLKIQTRTGRVASIFKDSSAGHESLFSISRYADCNVKVIR